MIYIYSDIDGVVSTSQKGFYDETIIDDYIPMLPPEIPANVLPDPIEYVLHKVKLYSDHDAAILSKLPNLVFISHDADINKQWAERHRIPFVHVPHGKNKLDYLCKHITGEVYPKAMPEFIYIGDTLHDLQCLVWATYSYIPQDAATSLLEEVKKYNNDKFIIVPRNGGCGVLDWVWCDLRKRNIL